MHIQQRLEDVDINLLTIVDKESDEKIVVHKIKLQNFEFGDHHKMSLLDIKSIGCEVRNLSARQI